MTRPLRQHEHETRTLRGLADDLERTVQEAGAWGPGWGQEAEWVVLEGMRIVYEGLDRLAQARERREDGTRVPAVDLDALRERRPRSPGKSAPSGRTYDAAPLDLAGWEAKK